MRTDILGKSCLMCQHSYIDEESEDVFCKYTDEKCIIDTENDIYTTCEEFEK